MANSKGKNIILGVVVIAVWGAIAFKIISYFNKSNIVELPASNVFKTAGIKVKKDKFKIDASYRDPFLIEVKEKISKPDINSRDFEFQNAKPQVRWPEIKYSGVIETSNKIKKVGLLQVNKRDFLVSEGDTTSKLTVIKIFKDSLRLKYSNEEKVFQIQKIK